MNPILSALQTELWIWPPQSKSKNSRHCPPWGVGSAAAGLLAASFVHTPTPYSPESSGYCYLRLRLCLLGRDKTRPLDVAHATDYVIVSFYVVLPPSVLIDFMLSCQPADHLQCIILAFSIYICPFGGYNPLLRMRGLRPVFFSRGNGASWELRSHS